MLSWPFIDKQYIKTNKRTNVKITFLDIICHNSHVSICLDHLQGVTGRQ